MIDPKGFCLHTFNEHEGGPYHMSKLFLVLFFILTSSALNAKELKGVQMPDEVQVNGTTLKLNGLGLRKAMSIFDVYVAGLYVVEPSKDAVSIINSNTPKRLVMRFKRFVEKSKLKDAWKEGFEKNADKDYSFSSDLLKLNDQMSHVQEKDEITYTFFSDHADIAVKDKPVFTIAGANFSKTLLKVFVNRPPDEDLKKGLLGQ